MDAIRMYILGNPIVIEFKFELDPDNGKPGMEVNNLTNKTFVTGKLFDEASNLLGDKYKATQHEDMFRILIPAEIIKHAGMYVMEITATTDMLDKPEIFPIQFAVHNTDQIYSYQVQDSGAKRTRARRR